MTKGISMVHFNGGRTLSVRDQFWLFSREYQVSAIVLSKRGRCIDVQTSNGPILRYNVDELEEIHFREQQDTTAEE